MRVSQRQKTYYLTNTPKSENAVSKSAFDDTKEEGISMVMFAFLSIFSLGFLLLFIAQ